MLLYEFGEPLDFINYGGKLAFVYHTDFGQEGLVDLWVMEDVGNWSRKSLGNYIDWTAEVPTRPIEPYYISFSHYDLQKNDLRKVQIRETEHVHMFSTSIVV